MNDPRMTMAQRATYKAPACPKCGNAMSTTWTEDTRGGDAEPMWDHADACQHCGPCQTCRSSVRLVRQPGERTFAGTRDVHTVRRCTNRQCPTNGRDRTFGDIV